MIGRKLCYVIMPFSTSASCSEGEWTSIFNGIIKPAVESAQLDYSCRRSSATTGNLIKDIVADLYQANVVIADLTDQRPNVFYELGVRHALKNRTIMIAQRLSDIPSDLHGYACVEYGWKSDSGQEVFAARIKGILQILENDVDRSDSPISDFLRTRSAVIFDFERAQNVRKLKALMNELRIIVTLIRPDGKQVDSKGKMWCPMTNCPAIDHYLATQYVASDLLSDQTSRLRALLALYANKRLKKSSFALAVNLDGNGSGKRPTAAPRV